MFMDSAEMQIFDLALHGLIAKAAETGKHVSPEEIARRMIIVQEAKVYDPEEFDRLVLMEDFAHFEISHQDLRSAAGVRAVRRSRSPDIFDAEGRRVGPGPSELPVHVPPGCG